MQLKFSYVKISSRIRRNLITLLLVFFPFFSINNCYAVAVGDPYGGGTVFCVCNTLDTTQCVTTPGPSGSHGLIMSNEDLVNFDSNPEHGVTWSSAHKKIGASAQSSNDGAANTLAIIAAHPSDNSSNNAAWLCHKYSVQETDPNALQALNTYLGPKPLNEYLLGYLTYDDWFLPSKNELNKIYEFAKEHNLIGRNCSGDKANGVVRCLVGGYSEDWMAYWSSSEYSDYARSYAWGQAFSNDSQHRYSKVYGHFAVRAVRAF
jgi:hypothetical protein